MRTWRNVVKKDGGERGGLFRRGKKTPHCILLNSDRKKVETDPWMQIFEGLLLIRARRGRPFSS